MLLILLYLSFDDSSFFPIGIAAFALKLKSVRVNFFCTEQLTAAASLTSR
jgi:hypothetical protein